MLFVFDWDGTLSDSAERIVRTMQTAIGELGLPVLEDAAVRNIIGLGLPEALRSLYPSLSPVELDPLREAYARHYVAADQQQPCVLFPGALDTLEALRERGCRLAVATGKSRRGLDRVLRQLGLSRYFDATRCADETRSKPHPQMLLELMTELRVAAADTVMVGDTEYDLAMAEAARVAPVAVTFGAHAVERLHRYRPVMYLDRLPQLLDWPDGSRTTAARITAEGAAQ